MYTHTVAVPGRVRSPPTPYAVAHTWCMWTLPHQPSQPVNRLPLGYIHLLRYIILLVYIYTLYITNYH